MDDLILQNDELQVVCDISAYPPPRTPVPTLVLPCATLLLTITPAPPLKAARDRAQLARNAARKRKAALRARSATTQKAALAQLVGTQDSVSALGA